MEVQFPTAQELNTMWGTNPVALMQQQNQIGLANQFAQQGLQRGTEDIRQRQLANLFSEQSDPLKLQQQQLANEGAGLTNRQSGVTTRLAEGTEGDQLMAQKKKLAMEASDADIKMMGNMGQQLAYSRNPQERAMGVELMKQHKDFLQLRETSRLQQQNQLAAIGAQGVEARKTQQQAIDAGKFLKSNSNSLSLSIEDQLRSGKLNFEKAAVLLNNAAMAAQMEGDVEKAQLYQGMANDYNNKHIASRQAGAQAQLGGKADMSQFGIQPNVVPPAAPFAPVAPSKPAAPGAQAPTGDIAVYQKAFGGYEPNKYDYRVGPGGIPQRRLKGTK